MAATRNPVSRTMVFSTRPRLVLFTVRFPWWRSRSMAVSTRSNSMARTKATRRSGWIFRGRLRIEIEKQGETISPIKNQHMKSRPYLLTMFFVWLTAAACNDTTMKKDLQAFRDIETQEKKNIEIV